MKERKIRKKKATKKEIKELKEIVIEIQRDPVTMKKIRKFVTKAV